MRILTLTQPNMENGLGCRLTIWVAGCSRHCEGCHNQHTWDYGQGTELTDDIVKERIYERVNKDYIQGLTISGGDPLDQNIESLKELNSFLENFKKDFPSKDIWIYSGAEYEDCLGDNLKMSILDKCDVMVDGPFKKDLFNRDLAFRGSSNQRIIDLNETKKQGKVTILELA